MQSIEVIGMKKPTARVKHECANIICDNEIKIGEMYTSLVAKLDGNSRKSTYKICKSCWAGDKRLTLK